jgi:hypothetical protein
MFSAAQPACTCSTRLASTSYRLLEPVQKIFVKSLVQVPPGTAEHGTAGIPPRQTDACNRAALICSVAVSQLMVGGVGWSILARSGCHS